LLISQEDSSGRSAQEAQGRRGSAAQHCQHGLQICDIICVSHLPTELKNFANHQMPLDMNMHRFLFTYTMAENI
jgi:hypothetical protein